MTREEIYNACLEAVDRKNCLLLESATGTGKTKVSIDLVNHLCDTVFKGKETSMLLLVAKTVHKETWKEEFEKWGGIKVNKVVMECYESMHKHTNEEFTFVIADEVHHIGSERRLFLMPYIKFNYFIGLSATIPRKLKRWFRLTYKTEIVSCDIIEAIEDEVLPEPEIILFPLHLDNRNASERLEINPKAPGSVAEIRYEDIWKYRKHGIHALVKCTQLQKSKELSSQIDWEKKQYLRLRNKAIEQTWLYHCGKRLEFYTDCKLPIVNKILEHLKDSRTITFCKTIEQAESVGEWCIHSKNNDATKHYQSFNSGLIDHITAVNILNENANLVNCKYAIFANLSSSDIVIPQRLGRAMRHKQPVIIVPYYKYTREEEIVEKMFSGYNKEFIREITDINEI